MSRLLTPNQLSDKLYEDLNLKQFNVIDATHILNYLGSLFQEQIQIAKKEGIAEGVRVKKCSENSLK